MHFFLVLNVLISVFFFVVFFNCACKYTKHKKTQFHTKKTKIEYELMDLELNQLDQLLVHQLILQLKHFQLEKVNQFNSNHFIVI